MPFLGGHPRGGWIACGESFFFVSESADARIYGIKFINNSRVLRSDDAAKEQQGGPGRGNADAEVR